MPPAMPAGEHHTTAARWRRWSSTTPSSPASPARITASAASSPPSSAIPARSRGGAGPCPAAASPASKPGKARNRSPAAAPPGSPARTTRHPTRSTGPPAIPGPIATTAIVPATTSTPTACSRSIRETGEIKWHYQFTPHDVKDRDATEPNVLVDTEYRGKPSKLLLHADRNGFFYVLDRVEGNVLLAKPFLRRVDWAKSIGPDGRPVVADPRGCPSDAANWDSTAFSPVTRLYYFMALEECTGKPTGLSRSDRPALPARHQHRHRRHRLGEFRSPDPRARRPGRAFWPPPGA